MWKKWKENRKEGCKNSVKEIIVKREKDKEQNRNTGKEG